MWWKDRGPNPGEGEIFRTCTDRPWGPPSLLYNGYQVYPGEKSGRVVTLTPHQLLVPWSRAELYLYSPYGPYDLYRASVPVQYSYTSTSLSACTVQLYLYSPMGRTACTEPQCLYSIAIPLLPLWAVRTVQSLSACTV